jgi:3'-phosphoadenosine 5'-phosphosulfate (PAPS) 3'-phosphatase
MRRDLEVLARKSHQIADGARAITLKAFRRPMHADRKDDGSPVTPADRAAESFMRAGMSSPRRRPRCTRTRCAA